MKVNMSKAFFEAGELLQQLLSHTQDFYVRGTRLCTRQLASERRVTRWQRGS